MKLLRAAVLSAIGAGTLSPHAAGRLAAVAAALALTSSCGAAHAAPGDTVIFVEYRTKAVRVAPSPNVGGATVTYRIVLRPDGSVEDARAVKGGKSGNLTSQLGKQKNQVQYSVVDPKTITRTTELETHFHKLTIKLDDKHKCSANIEFTLKPGQTYFRDYSAQLKEYASYSNIEMISSACTISD
jgi:hypothetical protein